MKTITDIFEKKVNKIDNFILFLLLKILLRAQETLGVYEELCICYHNNEI